MELHCGLLSCGGDGSITPFGFRYGGLKFPHWAFGKKRDDAEHSGKLDDCVDCRPTSLSL